MRDFNHSRPHAQWKDLATLNLSRMHSGKYFHTARERKKGVHRERDCARARTFRSKKPRDARASREARSRSIDPHYVVGAPLFTTASIESGTEKERGQQDDISVNHIDRRRRPATASRARNMGRLALGIPERRG